MIVKIPVSAGELIDKITILEIKVARISDPRKVPHIMNELATLREIVDDMGINRGEIPSLTDDLRTINTLLWDIEEEMRVCNGLRLAELARKECLQNDERASVKRRINLALSSAIVEEKSYDQVPASVQ